MNGSEAVTARGTDTDSNEPQTGLDRSLSTQSFGETSNDRKFRCPVCGAEQTPADECRRCRADLELFIRVQRQVDEKRLQCLALMQQRRLLKATQLANECLELSVDERNLRLLATCYLLQGDFANALRTLSKAE